MSRSRVRRPQAQINAPVFFISAGVILAFVCLGALFTEQAATFFSAVQGSIVAGFGWFYIAVVAGFLIFTFFLMLSRYGDVKLGPDDAEPDYSYLSWFAMLFSAGMGIGLMFFGVAEPIYHYMDPPVGEGNTLAAARQAMIITFFHWGLHAWAIYIVVGLALAYFAFRRGLPLTIRSALYPLIGARIHGPIGHAADIFAVFGTMFGVATSLGLGVLQVNAGLEYLFGLPANVGVQLALIAVITGLATVSVMLGLDAGIRRLSELNIILAVLLLGFVLTAGPTVFLLQALMQNTGAYLDDVVRLTFRMYAYEPNEWLGSWTLFYWGWWIAWSPFVGMFIARISRGRTIREFVLGVLFVPVLFTFLWMTVFGNTALWMQLNGIAPIGQVVADNMPVALFALLEALPLSTITSVIATLLVVTFFVTSADSGALVIDMITSGGAEEPPVWQRIFWAISAGVVAAVLLVAGGLQALQTAAIASALPFSVIMVLVCYGLLRALQLERMHPLERLHIAPPSPARQAVGSSWQRRLSLIMHFHDREEVVRFLNDTARPALEEVAAQIRQRGLEAQVEPTSDQVQITVMPHLKNEFRYRICMRSHRIPTFAFPELAPMEGKERRHYRAEVYLSDGPQHYEVTGYTREQVINDFLARYEEYMQIVQTGQV
ncbi:BCCT family transporter [Microvirga sp. GCM10011540]|uniref:BCCT family transporter n=1 Tax=Microvirga sp. GCM10011540 TaxID=3317338 RepID=UPI00360E27EB